jgi:hypothetical protein
MVTIALCQGVVQNTDTVLEEHGIASYTVLDWKKFKNYQGGWVTQ